MPPPPPDHRSSLLALLSRFEPDGPDEALHLASIVALVSGSAGCFSRSHFVPGHVTASAFVVDPATGRLLLHHHRRLDRWLQMGGHVDPGEAPLDAALREAREESGLDALVPLDRGPFDLDVHPIPAGKGEPDHLHFDVRWALAARHPERIAADPAESLALAWFDLDAAAARMAEPAGARAVAKLRRRLASR